MECIEVYESFDGACWSNKHAAWGVVIILNVAENTSTLWYRAGTLSQNVGSAYLAEALPLEWSLKQLGVFVEL